VTSKQFLQRNNTNPATGHWTLSESILLNEIVRKRRRNKTKSISVERVTRIYNAAVTFNSSLGKEKTERQVKFKWHSLDKKSI
jgi:hypothetical protein